MIDVFIIIILVMLGCIGLGVLFGWSIWGHDMKYYKNLAELYKNKLESPDVKEAILEKRSKDMLNKVFEKRSKDMLNKVFK